MKKDVLKKVTVTHYGFDAHSKHKETIMNVMLVGQNIFFGNHATRSATNLAGVCLQFNCNLNI